MNKFKIILQKSYFDKGWGLLTYFKYIFALVGLGSLMEGYDLKFVIGGALIYGVVCYFLGRIWMRKGFYECELEVANKYNLFVKQMRKATVKS